ncbi:MAG: hypothetical protein LLG04_13750 [Parachlamydia sp.]|nr:hypothetical protein [Parachlamydia sp.]
MKTLLTLALLFAASVQAYESYPMQNYLKEQEREFNDKMDRIQNNVYRQEQLRIQNEALRQLERHNNNIRYGR